MVDAGVTCDVVVPCRDEAAALPLVLADVPAGLRVVVVDNGSTDGTADVARSLGAVVVHESRPGYGAAVHAGVEAAEAEYVAVIDGDDSMRLADLLPMLDAVRRDGNALVATLGSDYGGVSRERRVDQVIVNHGTRPLDDLYFDLKPQSANKGAVDYEALVAGQPQPETPGLQLYRIGDAVAARNTHAAIYDALRLGRRI